jgi:hypothetical protein
MICVLVVTDGREDYLSACVESASANLTGPITERVMYDDTGDPDYRRDLARRYPGWRHINAGPRQGFGGAIRAAWSYLAEHSRARWVFHLEQDFTFNRPVDLAAMARALHDHPHLVQLALRRQPWNDQERQAGGIVEQHPDAYTEVHAPYGSWLEHHLFFTTNPCLYRRTLCSVGWPEGGNSEGHFGFHLRQHGSPEAPGDLVRFGYWGTRDSGEAVNHIGHQRAGIGY